MGNIEDLVYKYVIFNIFYSKNFSFLNSYSKNFYFKMFIQICIRVYLSIFAYFKNIYDNF